MSTESVSLSLTPSIKAIGQGLRATPVKGFYTKHAKLFKRLQEVCRLIRRNNSIICAHLLMKSLLDCSARNCLERLCQCIYIRNRDEPERYCDTTDVAIGDSRGGRSWLIRVFSTVEDCRRQPRRSRRGYLLWIPQNSGVWATAH